MKTIWKGKLATKYTVGSGPSKEFDAEIIEQGAFAIMYRRDGENLTRITPHDVDNVSLFKALVKESIEKNDILLEAARTSSG